MKNPALFLMQATLLGLIALVHAYALSVDLYWHYPIANRLIHFSGGLWVALASVWLLVQWGKVPKNWRIALMVIGVSVAWEIFEFAIGIAKQEANYVLDTVLDLTMDLIGGYIGYSVAGRMVQLDIHEGTAEDNSS